MRLPNLFILVITAAVFSVSSLTVSAAESQDSSVQFSSDEKNFIGSINEFGLELFREIVNTTHPDSNVFISPLSVAYALGMVYHGARGKTQEAIGLTLNLEDFKEEEIINSFKSVTDKLLELDRSVDIRIGNSIWYPQTIEVRKKFLNINQEFFDATVKQVDFQDNNTVNIINQWVDERTNGKIKEVVQPPLSPDLKLLLINATYFKGNWTYPFNPKSTHARPFYVNENTVVDCLIMGKRSCGIPQDNDSKYLCELNYFEDSIFQAANMTYGIQRFSMTILLPKPSSNVEEVVKLLDSHGWLRVINMFNTKNNEVAFGMPKFSFNFEITLNDILSKMGMGVVFNSESANFGGIFANKSYKINQVKQVSFIKIDEEGTEAVAVTFAIVDSLPPQMIVDRPFIIVVHEQESGAILFIGKVSNPTWADG